MKKELLKNRLEKIIESQREQIKALDDLVIIQDKIIKFLKESSNNGDWTKEDALRDGGGFTEEEIIESINNDW